MTFGLRNASQTFQRHINQVLQDETSCSFAYIDDICIASENMEQHRQDVQRIFKKLKDHNLTINLEKCSFAQPRIDFLGHSIDEQGIRPMEEKIKAIKDTPQPKLVKDLKSFLGVVNFYRPFLPKAAEHQDKLQVLIPGNRKNDRSPID